MLSVAGPLVHGRSVLRLAEQYSKGVSIPSVSDRFSVQLTGIPPGTNEDILTMYMENTRKSGGGAIRSLQYNELNGTAVVCFEDYRSKNDVYVWFIYMPVEL